MRTALAVAVSLAALLAAPVCGGDGAAAEDAAGLAARARRAGLRVLEGGRLLLATDRPVRDGDGVDLLPQVFEQAFATWCRHYDVEPDTLADWRSFGCLIIDPERFRAAGLLPDDVPAFDTGFCSGHRFWMIDQSNPAYRRHLLLHEGVHAFTLTVRRSAAPIWYHEGIAEYLATHRLEAVPSGIRFVPTPIPSQAADVEQLGRIERIRDLRRETRCPSLDDVLVAPVARRNDIGAYATKWALVAMLTGHPRYAAAFADLERGPLDADFNVRLARMPRWDAAQARRDFDAFTDEIDYGYDFARSAIDWAPGARRQLPARVTVDASRGWQNSGISIDAGTRCGVAAEGRFRIGSRPAPADEPLESEADGITLRWYRGRPVGRLLAAQWVDRPTDGGRPRFVVVSEGARGEFTASVAGPIHFKVNESPGEIADNLGTLSVEVSTR